MPPAVRRRRRDPEGGRGRLQRTPLLDSAHQRQPTSHSPGKARVKHVLLISVDGLHQSDLEWYVANHPSSELAKLVHGGAEFGNAHALAGRIAIAICQRPPM